MKKFFTTLLLFLAVAPFMSAQSIKIITSDKILRECGGQQIFSISGNGRYVCGTCITWEGFIYDVQEDKMVIFTEEMGSNTRTNAAQLLHVTDEGVAVGFDDNGGIVCDINGNYKVVGGGNAKVMGMFESCNADASIIVGSTADAAWNQTGCYWENGERIDLTIPTAEELGIAKINGFVAEGISEDGSVIMGHIIDRLQYCPLVLWIRQEDGTYKCDPASIGKFEPHNTYIRNEEDKIIGVERGDNPYIEFSPAKLSRDGKTVAMHIMQNTDELFPPLDLGLYDIESREVIVAPMNDQRIKEYSEITVTGISNNLDVVGIYGSMAYGTMPFISMAENLWSDQTLQQAFPDVEGLKEIYQECFYENLPWFASDISADGRYIAGYYAWPNLDLNAVVATAFIIDRDGELGAVEIVGSDKNEGPAEYYNINGLKMREPVKGFNIQRNADGTSKKIFVK